VVFYVFHPSFCEDDGESERACNIGAVAGRVGDMRMIICKFQPTPEVGAIAVVYFSFMPHV